MPTTKDYYVILGVPRDADDKKIKQAYRRLARKYHPDVNREPGAEARFKEISEAFAVLSDKEKRAKYDRGGHAAFGPDFNPFAGTQFGGFEFRSTGGRASEYGITDLSQIFEMFGLGKMGAGRSAPRRGQDLELAVDIPFLQAVQGSTITLEIPRRVVCTSCGGSGSTGGSVCGSCRGDGRTRRSERVTARIPAGIQGGGRVRLAGKGDAGLRGGPSGDAFLRVNVEPHPMFRAEGDHLLVDVPVSVGKATLGAQVAVPTPDGSATIEIPAGTRSGQKFRLKGRGVPARAGRPAGDLLAVIQIHPPQKLDKRSRELMEEFERLNER